MAKKRVRLNSDISEIHKKEKCRISFNIPKSVTMKYLEFDATNIHQPFPTFQGKITIPIRLHKFYPKTKYGKENRFSLKLDKLDYQVGIPPFSVNVTTLGHYFESNRDVDEEITVTISTWLMSPELLDRAVLEFSITLVGEEKLDSHTFYSLNSPINPDNEQDKPIAPVWSITKVPFKMKLKLLYDVREFDRILQKSFSYYNENLRLALNGSAAISGVPQPILIPEYNLEMLKNAKYLSKQTLQLIKEYESLQAEYLKLQPYKQHHPLVTSKENFSKLSKKLLAKIRKLERIRKTYEKISLKKMKLFPQNN